MFQNPSSTALLGLLLCAASATAQVNVTLQLPFAHQMPARIAEWRENESLIRIVVQNVGRERYEGLLLSVELTKDGRRIARSRDGHPAQPRWSLAPGEIRSLSWREVISEESIEYEGALRQQVITTGELPEGSYQLCLQVLTAQMRSICVRQCGSFQIVLADPPMLVTPIGGAHTPPTPLLQWAPSNIAASGLQYQVTVKVRYQGQTPAQAMASNSVRLQIVAPTTSYQVPIAEQLGPDATDPNYAGHVWQVQALLNGRPYGRNQGMSQIEWFRVVTSEAVKSKAQERPITVVDWVLPYKEGESFVLSPNIQLRKGDSIRLQIMVSGLKGIQGVVLKIENATPEVVEFVGGNIQTIPIHYNAISPEGTFFYTLSGISTGMLHGLRMYSFFGCSFDCEEGKVQNREAEIAFTPKDKTPEEMKNLILIAKILVSLPRKSPFAPSYLARALIDAAPKLAQTRSFDVWVRVCCEVCVKTKCWRIWEETDWEKKCSPWKKVMNVPGMFRVGDNDWEPTDTTWEEIEKKAEDAAKEIECK